MYNSKLFWNFVCVHLIIDTFHVFQNKSDYLNVIKNLYINYLALKIEVPLCDLRNLACSLSKDIWLSFYIKPSWIHTHTHTHTHTNTHTHTHTHTHILSPFPSIIKVSTYVFHDLGNLSWLSKSSYDNLFLCVLLMLIPIANFV